MDVFGVETARAGGGEGDIHVAADCLRVQFDRSKLMYYDCC